MARARNIKPGFFENEDLAELPVEARLLFIGLWTQADREGRLEDRPKRLKMQMLPMDDVDVDGLLQALHDAGFIYRYGESTRQVRCKHQCQYIQVLKFSEHQSPHCKEKESTIPAPDMHGASTGEASKRGCETPPDSLIPDSPNDDSKEANASSTDADETASEAKYTIPLTGGKPHPVTQADIDRYRELFPSIDVEQSIRAMLAWIDSNPSKRSGSVRGAKTRMTSWLTRDQDKASRQGKPNGTKPPMADSYGNKTYEGTPDDELPASLR